MMVCMFTSVTMLRKYGRHSCRGESGPQTAQCRVQNVQFRQSMVLDEDITDVRAANVRRFCVELWTMTIGKLDG